MLRKRKPEDKNPVKRILIMLSIIVSVVLVALVIGIGLQLKKTSDQTTSTADNSHSGGETRPTLPSSRFSDPFIAEAYRTAKDIPHVLDSLKCYCFCDRQPFNHKSLLSCYVNTHAAGWGTCLNEARRASELNKEGKSIQEIRTIIDKEFG